MNTFQKTDSKSVATLSKARAELDAANVEIDRLTESLANRDQELAAEAGVTIPEGGTLADAIKGKATKMAGFMSQEIVAAQGGDTPLETDGSSSEPGNAEKVKRGEQVDDPLARAAAAMRKAARV